MGAHARNSPSALHRTLNCPPSLVLGEQFQDEPQRGLPDTLWQNTSSKST